MAVCGGVLLYMLLSNLDSISEKFDSLFKIISPIIIGLVLAYLVNPIANFFEKKVFRKIKKEGLRWTISVITAILCVIIIIAVFIITLVPSLIDSFKVLGENAENYVSNIEKVMDKLNDWGVFLNLKLDWESITKYVEEAASNLLNYLGQNMKVILNTSQDIGNSLFNIVVGLFIGVYFLFGKKGLVAGGNELRSAALKEETYKKHNDFWRRCHEILIQYIGYNLLDGLIVGVVNGIVMLILKMPYVALISVVVGVTNLLPTFGPIIGAVIGAFILFLNRPVYALWFLIFTVILQTLDGYVLKPKLFGGSFGIPAVWTLIAIVVGGKLFGVLGIFLAIPFAAVVSFLYKERFLPWLKNRNHKPIIEKEEMIAEDIAAEEITAEEDIKEE